MGQETYKIIRQPVSLPAEARGHAREALGLDEVVEGERREHGAVAVDVGLDEEGGAADAVEVDFAAGIAVEICCCCVGESVGRSIFEKKKEGRKKKKDQVSFPPPYGLPLVSPIPESPGFSFCERKGYVPAI